MANREITDHMDRLPRDVAQERMHDDIVRLLEEHCPRPPPQHHHLISESLLTPEGAFLRALSCSSSSPFLQWMSTNVTKARN
jgi:Notch 3